MSRSEQIKIMISSQCEAEFAGQKLTEIRNKLKNLLEEQKILDKTIFKIWINEPAPAESAKQDWWDTCLKQVDDCDILIVLYNGHSGSPMNNGGLGICHAEYNQGVSNSPGKVYLIQLSHNNENFTDGDKAFLSDIKKYKTFNGGVVEDEDSLTELVKNTIHGAVLSMLYSGVNEYKKGKRCLGEALEWSNLDFHSRKNKIIECINDALKAQQKAELINDNYKNFLKCQINGANLLIKTHAIPASLSIPSALEIVGQPFQNDYKISNIVRNRYIGPLHIIGCHKTATENQARKLLGFSDAIIIAAPFGIYVADEIQKIQFVFIVGCYDASSTKHGIQRFFNWLEQSNEKVSVVNRATSRANILQAIAREQKNKLNRE